MSPHLRAHQDAHLRWKQQHRPNERGYQVRRRADQQLEQHGDAVGSLITRPNATNEEDRAIVGIALFGTCRKVQVLRFTAMSNELPDRAFEVFVETLSGFEPSALTACSNWTVRDLVVHMVSGADEILRHLKTSTEPRANSGNRSFAEREAAWANVADDDLRTKLPTLVVEVNRYLDDLLAGEPGHVMPGSGRQMRTAMFRSHLRHEFALHRWDMIGSDDVSVELLSDPSLTVHTVRALAGPLVCSCDPDA
jgi:uncharacterized protein (TIGR03083 family)